MFLRDLILIPILYRNMDVIFEREGGEKFEIEVGFFDTVLEIKEKIQKYHRIPISDQTLIFNAKILQDDRDVEFCGILQDSHIKLVLPPPPPPPPPANNSNNKIQLNINISCSSRSRFPIEMNPNHTIRRLKERIHEMDAAVGPVDRMVIHSNGCGAELQDQRSLRECELTNNSEIEVCLRGKTSRNKLKVMVLSKCGTSKIPMEVNPTDNVGELKRELKKVQRKMNLNLPQDGFFFIHDQDVMDDDRSFRWHGVTHGDTIEIFNGSVTGGT